MIKTIVRVSLIVITSLFILASCASSKKYKGGDCPSFSSMDKTTEINARG